MCCVLPHLSVLEEHLGGRNRTKAAMSENLQRVRSFRCAFPEFEQALPSLAETLPALLTETLLRLPNLCRDGDQLSPEES